MKTMRQFLRYLNWLLNPVHGLDTSQVYDLIDTASLTNEGLFLNLGYWRQADNIDDASRALAMLVAERGKMTSSDTVLDCGFGFADQDMLWAEKIRPQKIIGINITASQVERARRRVSAAGLDHRIELRKGSATDLSIDGESVDLVTALESAFHFDTREAFFREAFRVLRPGGRLVTADILPTAQSNELGARLRQRLSWYLVASRFNIPRTNVYGIDQYQGKLQRTGFGDVEIQSIRDDVYAPLHASLADDPGILERQHPLARFFARATLKRPASRVYAGLDYVVAVAVKPIGH